MSLVAVLDGLSVSVALTFAVVMLGGPSSSVVGDSIATASEGDSVIADRARGVSLWLAAVLTGLNPSLMYWVRFSRASSRVFWEVEKLWLLTCMSVEEWAAVVDEPGAEGVGATFKGSMSASSRGGRTSLCACFVFGVRKDLTVL